MRVIFVLAAVALLPAPPQLSTETLKGYDRYVAATEQRIAGERQGKSPLFYVDRLPEKERPAAWNRLRRGETVVAEMSTREGAQAIDVKNGRVHHWVATVLVPKASADRILGVVRDYPSYPKVFAPLMTRAKILERGNDRDVVTLRTHIKKLVNVVMEGDYVMEYYRLGPGRVATTTIATNLHQVHNDGRADERREPADQTAGYLWRYRMYCTLEERPEGTLDQCESLTLTRPVPVLVSWLVGGTVAAIPRDSLVLMLTGARAALK